MDGEEAFYCPQAGLRSFNPDHRPFLAFYQYTLWLKRAKRWKRVHIWTYRHTACHGKLCHFSNKKHFECLKFSADWFHWG